ncbi:MAG: S-layer homology domain-containing protein [Candidatus Ornithomonoglobus sp.]
MKKLLSAITAVSLLAASTAGLSVNAAGFKFSNMGFRFFEEAGGVQPTATAAATATATATATASPAVKPTDAPTAAPTAKPTENPTQIPTATPTATPTEKPTEIPTTEPTATPAATDEPTATPEVTATPEPTQAAAVTGLTLNKKSLTLDEGETFKLEASTEPENAPDESVTWSSTSDCVKVDENGNVTAVSAGEAIVSATTVNSKFVASCYINVVGDKGTVDLAVTEGVKQVIITKDGCSTELSAGKTLVEAGAYIVSAVCYDGYELSDYDSTATISAGKETDISVSAVKTSCAITIPSITGVTVTPVNGSVSPVDRGGSYSFTVSPGSSYDSSKLIVRANGEVLTAENGVYTIAGINDDVVIAIEGVEAKSWDATLKSLKVKGEEAVLGADNKYTVVLPYGETTSISDIVPVTNDSKANYTVSSENNQYVITVKAEDGTTNTYTLEVTNSAATEIDDFKLAIAALKFSDATQTSSGTYDSQDTVKAGIETKIKSIASAYPNVSYTIEAGESLAPVKGTLASPTGVDGYYKFTVVLSEISSLSAAEERIIGITIAINSYDYVVSLSNITATTTTMTIKNLDSNCEIALFTTAGGKLRSWTSPTNGTITFSNLTGGETYVVKMRAAGSSDVPATGTSITMQETKSRGTSKYYTVTFDEGEHGQIVSGKAKQTVRLTGIPDYPQIQADDGYVFKGWSSNGVLITNPKTYFIRSATSFTAIYEKSSGTTYSSSTTVTTTQPTTVQGASAAAVVNTFYDVPQTSWYYNSVSDICKKGYMNGTTNGMFEPEATLTRAMLVTVLYRYACEPNVDMGSGFADVPDGTWYSDAVTWAADAGIVNGTTNNMFEPDANITREQLAAIMYRYSDAFGYDISASGNIINYADSSRISDWAQTALIWTTGAGIINGKDGNMLDPQGNATRAEAATIIERFDSYINS